MKIATFHYCELDSLPWSCILRGTLKSATERSSIGRTDAAYHRQRGIEIREKFGVPQWSHNKVVLGRPLQMQPADIEIYWKTWSISASREYMPGSQVTRRGSEGSRVVG